MPKITVLAYNNCAMSSITGMIDSFELTNRWHFYLEGNQNNPFFTWDIVSHTGEAITDKNGFSIKPAYSIHELKSTDLIFIPGFLMPFEFKENIHPEIIEWLKEWHEKGVIISSTCTGTFLVAETGLLDGRTATTNWYFSKMFRKLYPEVELKPQRLITEENRIISSGATTSFFNLCVYLIEKFGSGELALYCSKSLLIDPSKTSQSHYMVFDFQKEHSDETILRAQEIMEDNFEDTISIESLASNLGISLRHFIRRFKKATGDSPLLYLQRIRIEAAKNKLETTIEPIDEITRMVGYEDTNSFRKLFKKHTGLSPRDYRVKFKRTG